jgi:hypothetical protein
MKEDLVSKIQALSQKPQEWFEKLSETEKMYLIIAIIILIAWTVCGLAILDLATIVKVSEIFPIRAEFGQP